MDARSESGLLDQRFLVKVKTPCRKSKASKPKALKYGVVSKAEVRWKDMM